MGSQDRWTPKAGTSSGLGRLARGGAIVLVPAALVLGLSIIRSRSVGDPRPVPAGAPRPEGRAVEGGHASGVRAGPGAERSRRTDEPSGAEAPTAAAPATVPGEPVLTGALQGPLRATVAILAGTAGRSVVGSGMVCSENGTLVTRARLVAEAEWIVARLFDGRRLSARVLRLDRGLDLAVLAVPIDEPLPTVLLGSTAELRAGDAVYALGAAVREGRGSTATRGALIGLRDGDFLRSAGQIETRTFLMHDAALDPEKDGGPLVDEAGRVIGLTTWTERESVGPGLAITVEDVARILREAKDEPARSVHSP